MYRWAHVFDVFMHLEVLRLSEFIRNASDGTLRLMLKEPHWHSQYRREHPDSSDYFVERNALK